MKVKNQPESNTKVESKEMLDQKPKKVTVTVEVTPTSCLRCS